MGGLLHARAGTILLFLAVAAVGDAYVTSPAAQGWATVSRAPSLEAQLDARALGNDTCAALTSCTDIDATIDCGWCWYSNKAMVGSPAGPTTGSCAAEDW